MRCWDYSVPKHRREPALRQYAQCRPEGNDPATQREAAGRIQRLLLEETPLIIAYFYDWLSVTAKNIRGVGPSANGQLYLAGAHFV